MGKPLSSFGLQQECLLASSESAAEKENLAVQALQLQQQSVLETCWGQETQSQPGNQVCAAPFRRCFNRLRWTTEDA